VLRYALRRLAIALPLALGVATLLFVLLEAAPGSPVEIMIGDRPVSEEVRDRIERVYGFDRSPVERYFHWLYAMIFEGDLGWSHSRNRPVSRALAEALPPTLALTGVALVLQLVIGILLGVASASRRGRWVDRLLGQGSLILYAMPTFWVGLMAILGLAYWLPIFPASSMTSVGAESWSAGRQLLDRMWHLALPAGVLAIASAAAMGRFVRAGLLQALAQEFVRAARARGVGNGRILWTHGLKNALIPVINLIGLSLPILISGSLVIEVVFAWPGMGRLTYEAILSQDSGIVVAATLLSTLAVVLGNLAADLAMAGVDPRIRLQAPQGKA